MLIMEAKHVHGWIVLQCPMFVACADHCAITVTLNFDQPPMTHMTERQKAQHINWKFEDVGL